MWYWERDELARPSSQQSPAQSQTDCRDSPNDTEQGREKETYYKGLFEGFGDKGVPRTRVDEDGEMDEEEDETNHQGYPQHVDSPQEEMEEEVKLQTRTGSLSFLYIVAGLTKSMVVSAMSCQRSQMVSRPTQPSPNRPVYFTLPHTTLVGGE